MPLKMEYETGLRLFALRIEADPERAAIWALLSPRMEAIAHGIVASAIKQLPALASTFEATSADIVERIVRCTGNLFVRPYDDEWVRETLERMAFEQQHGFDIRARVAVNRVILTELGRILARRYRFGGARVARAMDVASRVLLHDGAFAANHHFAGKVREASRTTSILTTALATFEQATEAVRTSVSQGADALRDTAKELGGVFEAVDQEAVRAAQASRDTAEHVRDAAGATERSAQAIEDLERESALSASQAIEAVARMVVAGRTVRSLSDAVTRIGSVVDVIADVANRTNLLALNATIEAARAGDAGRGFSVVAQEVKALATQTTGATAQIAELIAAVRMTAEEAVGGMEGAEMQIGSVADVSRRLAAAVHRQLASSDDIAKTAEATAGDAATVTTALATVSQGIERTKGAAASIYALSEGLARQTCALDEAVELLFETTRATISIRSSATSKRNRTGKRASV